MGIPMEMWVMGEDWPGGKREGEGGDGDGVLLVR